MKLSIMITAFNCAEFIDKAISSVMEQNITYQWELLIGDDGSNDGTVEKIKTWIAKYPDIIKLFCMDRTNIVEKTGMRAARNRANLLIHATGDYLAYLDGDDELIGTEKFKKQIELLDKAEYSGCVCAAHNIIACNYSENKKYLMVDSKLKDKIIKPKHYWRSLYFHTNTIVFRKCCKDMMLNNLYRDYLNDNFITYIIVQHGNILYTADVFAQYNITGQGLWTGKKRTYGCFRNLVLYDLEIQINAKMKRASFARHLYDLMYIFKNYNSQSDSDVHNLVDDLPKSEFRYTYLMSQTDKLTFPEKISRMLLSFKCMCASLWIHMISIKRYIKRMFNCKEKKRTVD